MNDLIKVPPMVLADVAMTSGAVEEACRIRGRCQLILRVVNERTQQLAADAASDARRFLKRVEDARKAVKEPVLALERQIDALARTISTPLAEQVKRIDGQLTTYTLEANRKLAEASRLAEEERRKAQAAADAEAKRIQAAAAQAAQAATSPVAAQQALDLGAAQAKQVQAAVAAPVVLAPPPRPSSVRVTTRWAYEVTDVWALAAHNRSLVRIEPSASGIRELIDSGVRVLPGVRIFEETKAGTTSR
jgi:hypothetical protein